MYQKILLYIRTNTSLCNRVACGVLICSLVIYIGLVNSISMKGFEIGELQKQIRVARADNREKQLLISELQSSERINKLTTRLDMVKVDSVEYIKLNGAFAFNR